MAFLYLGPILWKYNFSHSVTAPDFKARGLSTIFFAEAKLSSKEWQELELFVESVNYQRNKNSEKVSSKKFF